jgi:hypothetical protein
VVLGASRPTQRIVGATGNPLCERDAEVDTRAIDPTPGGTSPRRRPWAEAPQPTGYSLSDRTSSVRSRGSRGLTGVPVPSSREGCPPRKTTRIRRRNGTGTELRRPRPRPVRPPLFDATNAAFGLHSRTLRYPFVG